MQIHIKVTDNPSLIIQTITKDVDGKSTHTNYYLGEDIESTQMAMQHVDIDNVYAIFRIKQ